MTPSPDNLTMTRQRRLILEELSKVTSHPTADEVFRMVRERLPHVSLGTVYRNLEILAQAGVIRKLQVGGSQMRFDANATTHTHIRCSGCGRVDDALVEPGEGFAAAFRDVRGYDVRGFSLELVGLCPECRPRGAGS